MGRQHPADTRITGDQGGGAAFGGGLGQVVAIEKIHHMGEHRCADIVEQPSRRLGIVMGEMPDDEPHTHAVAEAGIGGKFPESRKIRILTSTVHPHLPQPLHGGRGCQMSQQGRNAGMVNGPEARPLHHSTAFFRRLHSPAPMAVAKVALSGMI